MRLYLRLPSPSTDAGQKFAFHDAVNTLSAKRAPCHHLRIGLSQNRFDARLLNHHVALQLVHHWLQLHIVGEVEESGCLEIAYTNGANLTGTIGFLHSPPLPRTDGSACYRHQSYRARREILCRTTERVAQISGHLHNRVDYPKILTSLKIKNFLSMTPLSCALKSLILALSDSAEALVDRFTK